MGERTVIGWTDASWNPWRGCTQVSPECAYCYMFRDQRRYGRDPEVVVEASKATFNAPLSPKWARRSEEIRAEQNRPMLVFTCSWSDWFHETADPWRGRAWEIVRETADRFTFQILTKRPERIAECLPADWGEGWPNVWLGVSIGNRRFVHRADQLRAVPAAVRFISAEPLLGPLVEDVMTGRSFIGWSDGYTGPGLSLKGIDWLITGGESGGPARRRLVDDGNQPRDPHLGWVRDLRDYAQESGTAFFHKQWGGPRPESGGRLLDGRTWDEFPTFPEPRSLDPQEALAL